MTRDALLATVTKFAVVCAFSLTAAMVATPKACADQVRSPQEDKAQPITVASLQVKAEPVRQTLAQRYPGNSPYICTPSGFGERAQCFLRSRIALH